MKRHVEKKIANSSSCSNSKEQFKPEKTFSKQKLKGEKKEQWLKKLPSLVEKIMETYDTRGDLEHLEERGFPSKDIVVGILNDFMTLLFPTFFAKPNLARANIRYFLGETLNSLYTRLVQEIEKSLKYTRARRRAKERPTDICKSMAQSVAMELLENIPMTKELLEGDIRKAFDCDPAAKSCDEIILSYPCVYAIAAYRISHELHIREVPIIPRIMTEHAHSVTGIDIHPGAKIGKNFFIDHGTGVVIGETTEIGDNVRIYQGVTLGGQRIDKLGAEVLRSKKRHPTIEDDVVIYSGATILGGKTVIGKSTVVGGNVWITGSIPPNTTVTIASPKLSYRTKKKSSKKGA